jgi:hypothetical protein
MNNSFQETIRVLAISPTSGGFGFAVFEGSERLIDWGLKTARHETNARCLRLVADLLTHYKPDVLVIEDLSKVTTRWWRWRRGRRVTDLLRRIASLAARRNIECRRISQRTSKTLDAVFGPMTKYQIATALTALLPELGPWLPKPRKIYMSEDSRMSIFDAAALALTFFAANSD